MSTSVMVFLIVFAVLSAIGIASYMIVTLCSKDLNGDQKAQKCLKFIFIVFAVLAMLFLALFFILNHQAAACDPEYEVGRHNALLAAAWKFLYMFPAAFAISMACLGTWLGLKYKKNKTK